MNNAEIAQVFSNIADLLEIRGEQRFTVVAYQRAARTVAHLPVELEQMVREDQDLKELPGIGQALSKKIAELVRTDELIYYDKLKAEFPDGILDVMHIPGVGPKTASRLWKELDVSSVDELERAATTGRLESLPRMGKKTAENILRSLQWARNRDERIPIARALPAAERIIGSLREGCPSITNLVVAGSLRRFEETIGDIDLVCTAAEPQQVLDTLVELPNVAQVLGHGDTKASVVLNEGVQVDLRVVEDKRLGSLLQYFTGSQQHAVRLREHAVRLGLSLNEYGVTVIETGDVETFNDEESLYARLGLQYVPPEIRQGGNEVQAALDHSLPTMIEEGDVRGDLHVHTDWTDGEAPMEAMVAAARDAGREYVALTDHSVGRGIANGLTRERLDEHRARTKGLDAQVEGIRVLSGSEVDIRADGTMDFPESVLAELDWVVGSIHSGRGQDSAVMTDRIIKAMRNPHVTAIGHLTTRMIGQREAIKADFEALFKAAADTGTMLEVNSSLNRLDLKDTHVLRARQLGAPLVISTDAHSVDNLDDMRFGVAVARRGWCTATDVANTLPVDDFLALLSTEKPRRTSVLAARNE